MVFESRLSESIRVMLGGVESFTQMFATRPPAGEPGHLGTGLSVRCRRCAHEPIEALTSTDSVCTHVFLQSDL